MKLLVIEVQNAVYTPALYAYDAFTENLTRLIQTARRTGTEVIFVRHDDGAGEPLSPGNPGFEIAAPFAPLPGERIFDKTVNSPFRGTGLTEYLQNHGEDTLMIAGLQTEYCVDAAVKCGFEHGFRLIVPAYANTTTDNAHLTGEQTYHYYNAFIWNRRYAACIPAADAIAVMETNGGAAPCS